MPQITMPTLAVLRELLEDERYGLQIAHRTGLASGSVYPILQRLERQGWVTSRWEDIDEVAEARRKRHYYRLTDLGRSEMRSALERWSLSIE